MTVQRQESYGIVGLAAVLGLLLASSMQPAGSATTERVVVGRFSGLAIGGYDPVAYFTDHRPLAGDPAIEAASAGAIWRFRNESNRAFFLENPAIYGPSFGGYDPVDVARGVAVAGDPRLWIVAGQRLYLFARDETRVSFAADPARVIEAANARWQTVIQELVP